MKRFSEQFHTKSQTVRLKKSEQAELRERIVSYMEYHPLPIEMRTKTTESKKVAARQPLLRDSFVTYQLPFANIFKFGGAFAAITLLVVPFMAERAMPGDTLYAVKVNFNEEVRSTLTLDPYEKVEWETTLINRRIAEAKLLQDEGLLTQEAEAQVAAAVKSHADTAKAEIQTIRESDEDTATIATIELDANLSLQAQVLEGKQAQVATNTVSTASLIATALDDSLTEESVSGTTTLPALDKLIARVEQNTLRVRELERSVSIQLDAAEVTDVARRIEDLERVTARALALTEGQVTESQLMLIDVLGRSQKLITFMTERDVRQAVTIESVVPVILTEDEIIQNRTERDLQIQTYLTQIQTAAVEDEEVQEKLMSAVLQIGNIQAELSSIVEYDQYILRSNDALAHGKDALLLLEKSSIVAVLSTASSTDTFATSTATTTEPIPEEEIEAVEEVTEVIATTTPAVEAEEQVEDTTAVVPDLAEGAPEQQATTSTDIQVSVDTTI